MYYGTQNNTRYLKNKNLTKFLGVFVTHIINKQLQEKDIQKFRLTNPF